MSRTGDSTKDKILNAAEALVMENGYGATSIDKVIGKAGITKGAFFYHFETKTDLAHALVSRFAQTDKSTTDAMIERASKLARDPLHRLLLTIGLFAEMFEQTDSPTQGCLLATFCYESALIDERTSVIISDALMETRRAMRVLLDEGAATAKPRFEINLDDVADMFTVIIEGGFVLERSFQDRGLTARQMRLYQNYVEMLFTS